MTHPFELPVAELESCIDELVDVTFNDIQSQFLILPKGRGFIDCFDFQNAYEILKKHTGGFTNIVDATIWSAFEEDSLGYVVLRAILGLSPPEWADLARSERRSDVNLQSARDYDTRVRRDRTYLANLRTRRRSKSLQRIEDLVSVDYITSGAPVITSDTIHRLDKFDTKAGLNSLQQSSSMHVPYAVLLYERYLGRPFASHRDSVSELVGDVMESAIERKLVDANVTFRRTLRAERIPGFAQAPDFFIPTEVAPTSIIEAKLSGDDGTTRDKVARILRLAGMRDDRERRGDSSFEVIACVDGRGFGVRRQDMKDMIFATRGKVFTLTTLDKLISHTSIQQYVPLKS